jgi:hypothetical protein
MGPVGSVSLAEECLARPDLAVQVGTIEVAAKEDHRARLIAFDEPDYGLVELGRDLERLLVRIGRRLGRCRDGLEVDAQDAEEAVREKSEKGQLANAPGGPRLGRPPAAPETHEAE